MYGASKNDIWGRIHKENKHNGGIMKRSKDKVAENILIVFAFDEARSLVHRTTKEDESYFTIVRRVSQELRDRNCFVLFTDTMVSMQFFMPLKLRDPSLRVKRDPIDILPPIYSLPTWDLCTTIDKQNQIKFMSQLVDMDHIASYGRPLWYTRWINIPLVLEENKNPIEMIDFAMNKLQCGVSYKTSSNQDSYDRLFLLAVTGCRVSIHLQPTSIECVNLVADFMAINLFVTKDRSRVFTTFGSEPILAEAAARLWNMSGKGSTNGVQNTIFMDAIPKLADFITEGTINQGQQGEITAQFILLKAMDTAVRNSYSLSSKNGFHFTGVVKVREFLEVLIGKKQFDQFYIYNQNKNQFERFLNGRICFNHFIQLTKKEPDNVKVRKLVATGQTKEDTENRNRKKRLLEFAKRFGALICEPGHKGTDIEIPVFLPLQEHESIIQPGKQTMKKKESIKKPPEDEIRLSTDNMTYILIQVRRNIKAPINKSKWTDISPRDLKYEKEPANNPFLYLHMQLGSCSNKVLNTVSYEFADYQLTIRKDPYLDRNQIVLATRGINASNFPFLNENEAEVLENLAFADQAFNNYLEKNSKYNPSIRHEYESVMEFKLKQKTNKKLEKLEKQFKERNN